MSPLAIVLFTALIFEFPFLYSAITTYNYRNFSVQKIKRRRKMVLVLETIQNSKKEEPSKYHLGSH